MEQGGDMATNKHDSHVDAHASPPCPDFEQTPLQRAEYITAMAHLYRGELQRSLSWRLRLDTTTNWAIFTTAGILTFAFNNPNYAAQTLLAGMFANLLFLVLEAQRFRFFDVFHSRLRMVEENFYGPLLRRDLESPLASWGRVVAADLLRPHFHISMRQAIRIRLGRVYAPLFIAQIIGWLLVVVLRRRAAGEDWLQILAIGRVPGFVPVVMVSGLFLFLLICVFTAPPLPRLPELSGDAEADVRREVPDLDA
jgi:uncharacterized membrane protein